MARRKKMAFSYQNVEDWRTILCGSVSHVVESEKPDI